MQPAEFGEGAVEKLRLRLLGRVHLHRLRRLAAVAGRGGGARPAITASHSARVLGPARRRRRRLSSRRRPQRPRRPLDERLRRRGAAAASRAPSPAWCARRRRAISGSRMRRSARPAGATTHPRTARQSGSDAAAAAGIGSSTIVACESGGAPETEPPKARSAASAAAMASASHESCESGSASVARPPPPSPPPPRRAPRPPRRPRSANRRSCATGASPGRASPRVRRRSERGDSCAAPSAAALAAARRARASEAPRGRRAAHAAAERRVIAPRPSSCSAWESGVSDAFSGAVRPCSATAGRTRSTPPTIAPRECIALVRRPPAVAARERSVRRRSEREQLAQLRRCVDVRLEQRRRVHRIVDGRRHRHARRHDRLDVRIAAEARLWLRRPPQHAPQTLERRVGAVVVRRALRAAPTTRLAGGDRPRGDGDAAEGAVAPPPRREADDGRLGGEALEGAPVVSVARAHRLRLHRRVALRPAGAGAAAARGDDDTRRRAAVAGVDAVRDLVGDLVQLHLAPASRP